MPVPNPRHKALPWRVIGLAELLAAFDASHRPHLNVLMLDCLGHLRVSTLYPESETPSPVLPHCSAPHSV